MLAPLPEVVVMYQFSYLMMMRSQAASWAGLAVPWYMTHALKRCIHKSFIKYLPNDQAGTTPPNCHLVHSLLPSKVYSKLLGAIKEKKHCLVHYDECFNDSRDTAVIINGTLF